MLHKTSFEGKNMHAMPFLRMRLPGEGRLWGITRYSSLEIDFGFQSAGFATAFSQSSYTDVLVLSPGSFRDALDVIKTSMNFFTGCDFTCVILLVESTVLFDCRNRARARLLF